MLPTRRRKDRDNDNDKENGLRMRNEKEKLKGKRFSFLPTRKKEKKKADPHLAHCLLPDTQANTSQKSKSQISPTFILLLLILTFSYHCVSAQSKIRRHFIIVLETTGVFERNLKNTPELKNLLTDLFEGNELNVKCISDQTNLKLEKNNNLMFFDPSQDEISLFHFGIAQSEFGKLKTKEISNYGVSPIIRKNNNLFYEMFLKNKNLNWSAYRERGNSIKVYLEDVFLEKKQPNDFGNGVALSYFVSPMVLTQIRDQTYSEEYVVIMISGFTSGTDLSNKLDYLRLQEIYGYGTYQNDLPTNSPPATIKSYFDLISSYFYKLDYFDFTFTTPEIHNQISIKGYKIKPKTGNKKPEDISIFVDSDVKMKQKGYNSDKYELSETRIKFTHNDDLKPQKIALKITYYNDEKKVVVFNNYIVGRLPDGTWKSNFANDKNPICYDSKNDTYLIPHLLLELNQNIKVNNYTQLELEYTFFCDYLLPETKPLQIIYSTKRMIQKKNVIFTTKTTIIIMYYVIPIIVLLLIIIYLVVIGKPKKIKLAVNGYLDSFETINYKKYGKLLTPYKYWDTQSDSIIIDGLIKYKSDNYLFNWKPDIYLSIQEEDVPQGFDLFLKPDSKTIKEYSKGNLMPIKTDRKNKFRFIVSLRQNDINVTINEPLLISFKIGVLIRESKLIFIKVELQETIEYKYHLGNDLGDLWVSFDPGTTGSCVAIGNHAENISVIEDRYNLKIIDSKLIFEITENYIGNNGEIPEELYKCGTNANTLFGTNRAASFQSIKKLLGFKDIKEITFKNNNTLKLTGKELSSLLVKGLYKDLTYFINKLNNPEFLHNGVFNPQRAVIAIPNNFTISKIQDMVDCVGYLKQFKEVRYVYEAEAVLFYYLSNYSRFNNGDNQFKDENILVFDMGGATINATIVSASKIEENQKPVYYIDFLGKIGYGIGGDTIDYCILKFIKKFANEYPQLNTINFNTENKENLVELVKAARSIKLQIVDYYEKGYDTLITTWQLNVFLQPVLGVSIEFSEESKFYENFKKDSKGKYKIFSHPIFIDLIYNNVKDAVNEVIDLSDNCKIDKVIFSGRSTFFPNIKETVEKQLKSKNSTPAKVTLAIEESKTAVAHGACWYGINKNSIRLNNLKTNASFGIKQTLTADTTNVEFIELIQMGCQFDSNNSEIDKVSGVKNLSANFSFDGGKVNFYQVMGKDANQILAGNQKHKFSKIASIRIPQEIEAVQMIVKEDDDVECKVKLVNNRVLEEKGVVSDQEIADANEEHYTWIIN